MTATCVRFRVIAIHVCGSARSQDKTIGPEKVDSDYTELTDSVKSSSRLILRNATPTAQTSTDRRVIVHVYVCVTHSSAKPVAPRRSQSASAESSTRPPHAARSASSLASNLLPEGERDGESGGGLSSSGACGGRRTV